MSNENEIVEKKDEPCAVVPMMPQMIRPIVTVEKAVEAWKEYQTLKTKLADKGDFAEIQGKQHPTKQFANKLSKFFGLSVQIVKAEKETFEDCFTWHIWARAIAPNGQFRESDGHCSSKERKFAHLEHDVYATAVTRAKNRTILELAGFGEVTAEEITDDERGERSQGNGSNLPTVKLTSIDGKTASLTKFKALEWFTLAKKSIGEAAYYEILGLFGYEHVNQVPLESMMMVWDAIKAKYHDQVAAKKSAKKP